MAAAVMAALWVGSTLREGSVCSETLQHLQIRIGVLPACQASHQQPSQPPEAALPLLLLLLAAPLGAGQLMS
jgi:hypothetical protein